MANVDKTGLVSQMTGIGAPSIGGPQPAMPTSLPPNGKANGLALAEGPDNIPATITDQEGNPQGPAEIKQGELIFPVEAIIGAGNGDYNKGAEMLLNLMDKLKAHGMAVSPQPGREPQGGLSSASGLPEAPQGLAAAPV